MQCYFQVSLIYQVSFTRFTTISEHLDIVQDPISATRALIRAVSWDELLSSTSLNTYIDPCFIIATAHLCMCSQVAWCQGSSAPSGCWCSLVINRHYDRTGNLITWGESFLRCKIDLLIHSGYWEVSGEQRFCGTPKASVIQRWMEGLGYHSSNFSCTFHCVHLLSLAELEHFRYHMHFNRSFLWIRTLTLALAIPSFQRMMQLWEDLKIKFPKAAPAIQDGLEKLKTYRDRTEVVPAYTLATSKSILLCFLFMMLISIC